MTLETQEIIECPNCEHQQPVALLKTLDVAVDPEVKALLFTGKLNIFHCDECEYESPVPVPFIYHDMAREIFVWYYPFGAVDDADFMNLFDQDGKMAIDSEAIALAPYMRDVHVVFSMEELIRYVFFRDRLIEAFGAD